MRRAARPSMALALAALALAGCVAPSAPDAALPDQEQGFASIAPERLALDACRDIIGIFPTPMAALPPVPAPLEPAPFDAAGALGTLFVIGAECAQGRIFLAAVAVTAPEAAVPEGANFTLALLGGYASDPELVAALGAWGQGKLEARSVPFDVPVERPARAGRVAADDAPGSEAMTVAGARDETTQPAEFGRFFLLRDGAVAGALDWHLTEARRRDGAATLVATSGLGAHFWGDGYAYEIDQVPLAALDLAGPRARPAPALRGLGLGAEGPVTLPGAALG